MGLNTGNSDLVLTTSANGIVGSTTSGQILILKASATNYDTLDHLVTLWRVPGGGTPGNSNLLMEPFTIPPSQGATVLPISGQTLVGGQTLQARADAGSVVNINVSFAMS